MPFNTIGLTPSPHTTNLGFQSPRNVKPVEDEVIEENQTNAGDTDVVTAKETTTGDTVQFSKKHQMKTAKADETKDGDDSMNLSAKQLEKAKAELKTELKKDVDRQLFDNEEIHKAKVVTSWWSSIPLAGPAIGLFSNIFINPEKNAENRADVKAEYRTKAEGIEQEQKVKDAKLKAALVTAVPQLVGAGIILLDGGIRDFMIERIKDNQITFLDKLSTPFWGIFSLAIHNRLAFLASILAGTSCILAPLGYTLFEKPDKENFNKRL